MPRQDPLEPRKKPIQARARRTVAAILEGAAQVFEQRGFAGATTDRIAERAGVSIGTLYQYFPNKDSILVALTEQHVDEGMALMRKMLAAAEQIPLDQVPLDQVLRAFLAALIAMHRDRPRLHQMLFMESPKPAGFLTAVAAQEKELAAELRTLLARHPDVSLPDLDVGVYVLMHVAEGLVHAYVFHPPQGVDEERYLDELVRLLRGYLSPAVATGGGP